MAKQASFRAALHSPVCGAALHPSNERREDHYLVGKLEGIQLGAALSRGP